MCALGLQLQMASGPAEQLQTATITHAPVVGGLGRQLVLVLQSLLGGGDLQKISGRQQAVKNRSTISCCSAVHQPASLPAGCQFLLHGQHQQHRPAPELHGSRSTAMHRAGGRSARPQAAAAARRAAAAPAAARVAGIAQASAGIAPAPAHLCRRLAQADQILLHVRHCLVQNLLGILSSAHCKSRGGHAGNGCLRQRGCARRVPGSLDALRR